ncbi:MAG: hypothetical protein HQL55_18015, partial [Magnetococcales bacterium]|nr:hypothetical protein [Magnetococcales bacterium]
SRTGGCQTATTTRSHTDPGCACGTCCGPIATTATPTSSGHVAGSGQGCPCSNACSARAPASDQTDSYHTTSGCDTPISSGGTSGGDTACASGSLRSRRTTATTGGQTGHCGDPPFHAYPGKKI